MRRHRTPCGWSAGWSLALLGAAAACGQQPPSFTLAGTPLEAPAAAFDPFGELRVRGTDAQDAARELVLSFPQLEPPAAGEYELRAGGALGVRLDDAPCLGTLRVTACGPGRAALAGELRPQPTGERPRAPAGKDAEGPAAATGPAVVFECDLPAPAVPARITGAPDPVPEPRPADRPVAGDLVFCALGNSGTGSDVQRRVGATVAGLAATGPLDHVLLLGDLVLPRGAGSVDDEGFLRCFVEPYPEVALPVLFRSVLGDRDHLGSVQAYSSYASASARFSIPNLAYAFTVPCHDQEVLFVGIDTNHYAHGPRDPAMRFQSRVLATRLQESQARLKIVFGHQSLFGSGPEGRAAPEAEVLRGYLTGTFARAGVDLYVSGSPHHLELVEGDEDLVEVVSGSGGGLVRSAAAGPGTRFASAEPGFAWFRYDGKNVEVSFRSAGGEVLHVHRWEPD